MELARACKAALLALGLFFAALPWAQAQEFVIKVQTVGDVKYANGGFGMEEREAMRALAGQFNLHLMFSVDLRSAFVAGVALTVADPKGGTVFELADAGPWTHVQLPPGRYRVSATYKGVSQARTVSLGARPSILHFQWKAAPEEVGEADAR